MVLEAQKELVGDTARRVVVKDNRQGVLEFAFVNRQGLDLSTVFEGMIQHTQYEIAMQCAH